MSSILRTLLQYNRMHRRIRNQRKQLAALNKAVNMWRTIAESLAHGRLKV